MAKTTPAPILANSTGTKGGLWQQVPSELRYQKTVPHCVNDWDKFLK